MMDEAFSSLDDQSDKEILERLESLFESSLPPLDSPILQDHAANAAASILDGTSASEVLESNDDIFGTSPAAVVSTVASSSTTVVQKTTNSNHVTSTNKTIPNSFILSPGPQPILTSSTTPTVIQGGTIQYTLQPQLNGQATTKVVSNQSKSKTQPQLLPKPSSSASTPLTTAISVSANAQQRPMVTMATAATPSSQHFVLNTGGVITGASTAPLLLTGGQSQPFLIQQPGGNPILVMRPAAPSAPAILPTIVASTTAQGTILLQPPTTPTVAASPGMVTAQPQIKIITPQGRMQMQQIQTPSGPKLIAVPVGAAQAAAQGAVVQQPLTSPNMESDKSKEAKKAKKKKILEQDNKSGLDLGELMKDVGLDDLDGYNAEAASEVQQQQQTAIISSTQGQTIMTAPLTLATSGGNQIVAQIPTQQIQIQQPAANNQFQLVQGPDGQFILQSTPTILAQATISGDGLAQGLSFPSGSTPLLAASGNIIGSVGGLTPAATTVIASTSVASASTLTTTVASAVSPPKKTRNPPDPNRTPLYHDERLPSGWHRKVSQRKSGASAGRFEVFIIGPTGKRFRSRNELKAFFEKTGETTLQPEHFDFSTFGTNVVNLPKEYAKKVDQPSSSSTVVTTTPVTSTSSHPVFKSQLSRETAEADAQISQLLESLQNSNSKKLDLPPVDSEKMSELFNSLAGDESCSSPPPAVIKPTSIASSTSANSSMPQLTSGTSGFQASFLNSIAGTAEKGKTESAAATTLSSPNNVTTVGGASTQRRAIQNLPQNTKLVRGPNGQYSLQKVQTIELTAEQQNNLRSVQSRIQEIERLPSKSAKDENELAQLHVKQQQILAAGKPVQSSQQIQEQVSLTTATSVVSSLNTSSSISIVPPVSKSIPVPNVTVTKSTPIRSYTVGNQSVAPSTTTTTVAGSTATTTTATTTPTAAITQLTDEQKRIVFEFKQKMALLPPDQQPAYIAQHKGALLKQLNFQPSQLQLLRNNSIQLQLSKPGQVRSVVQPVVGQVAQVKKPLPVGAGTIRQQNDEGPSSPAVASGKQKNIAWIENQIRKDQHEAVNPKYKLPFKSKDDAIKRLLRYHVFFDLDSSPEEMVKGEEDFEEKSNVALDKYENMLNRYHYLLTQEAKREISSSEEVMLARLWDSEERQLFAREKEEVEAGNNIDVPLLDSEKRNQYSSLMAATMMEQSNAKKRKIEEITIEPSEEEKEAKFPRTTEGIYQSLMKDHADELSHFDNTADDDSDEEFTLKDVDTERAVGSILDAATSNDEDEDDDEVDDVLQQMTNEDDDVVAAAFGTDSVQNAINSILDTLPQGDRIETPDINNLTGLFDSIAEDEPERDPMTEAAVNSIPQF